MTASKMERATFRGLLLLVTVILALWAFGLMLWPFILPIAWALCLAAVTAGPFRLLLQKTRRPKLSALIMVVLVMLLILGPIWLIGMLVVEEAVAIDFGPLIADVEAHFPRLYDRAQNWLGEQGIQVPPGKDVFDVINQRVQEDLPTFVRNLFSGGLGGDVLALVSKPFFFLFNLIIMLVTLYFVYCDASKLRRLVIDISPLSPDETDQVLSSLRETTSAAIIGGILIALLQGALGALMFGIAEIRSPVLWGLVMAVFSLLPFGGTALIWVPAGVYLLSIGSTGMGIFVLVFGAVIVGGVDNIMRPWVMRRTGAKDVHPMLLFFAILSGIGLFGVSGIVFGPLLLAFLTTLVRLYRSHFSAHAREAKGA